MTIRNCVIAAMGLALWTPAAVWADEHEHDHGHAGDIIIGRSAGNQLMIEFGGGHVELGPIVSLLPGYEGWAGEAPGFDHLHVDELGEGFYTLPAGVDVVLMALAGDLDTALKVRDESTLVVAIDSTGGSLSLGDEELHTHAIWQVDSTVPGFDPLVDEYEGTFFLRDNNGQLSDSAPFHLHFEIVPEPGALSLLGMGTVFLLKRRRQAVKAGTLL